MNTAKVSEYRSQLAAFHKKIQEDHDPLLIPGQDGNVVVMSEDDYNRLMETLYILRDRRTMKSLMDVRDAVQKGAFSGNSIEKEFADVLDS